MTKFHSNMKQIIPFKELLINYFDSNLSNAEKREVEAFILKNPEYQEVFQGFAKIKREIGNKDLQQYLTEKKAAIRKKVFNH
jgi:anti-sigma factor RsiW